MSRVRAVVPTLAALVVVAVTVSLGNWQLRRASQAIAMQQQAETAARTAPVPLGSMLATQAQVDSLLGRRATVRGRFLPERAVYLDNRTYKGIAGFYVLTPLRIEGGAPGEGAVHVLVLRGWVAADPNGRDAVPVVPAPSGSVEVTGLVERELPQAMELQRSAAPSAEQRIWQNVTRDAYAAWSGLTLQPLVLRQVDPAVGGEGPIDDGLVRDWPHAGLDVDKHRGYAFQWYALALTAALLWLWFVVVRPLRSRGSAIHPGSTE